MRSKEEKIARLRASILLEKLESDYKAGQVTFDDYHSQKNHWQSVINSTPGNHTPQVVNIQVIDTKHYSEPIIAEITRLQELLNTIDRDKAHLSNQSVHTSGPSPELSSAILKKRQEWVETKARLDFIKDTGTMPDVVDDHLPDDRYELLLLKDKLKRDIDSFNKRSKSSKGDATKQTNAIKLAQARQKRMQVVAKLETLNNLMK